MNAALLSGQLAQGETVRRFERQVAAACGHADGVATNSGTSALHLALLALGVQAGDEVLMPSYTCVALLHAVHYVGAQPCLVEVDPHTYNMAPRQARRLLNRRTRAIIVPHMFGLPADVAAMAEWDVPIIEDCAQAIGATIGGRPVGAVGTIAICSFYATKVLTTGEGGMLVASDPRLLDRARDARDYDGRAAFAPRFNYKMTEMQAALGLSQLARLPAFLARRRNLAARYSARLRDARVRLPAVPEGRTHIFYRYVVGVPDADRMINRLAASEIEAKRPVFRPIHSYVASGEFPRTDEAMRTAVSLPIHPSLDDTAIDAVAKAVIRVCGTRQPEKEAPSRLASSSR